MNSSICTLTRLVDARVGSSCPRTSSVSSPRPIISKNASTDPRGFSSCVLPARRRAVTGAHRASFKCRASKLQVVEPTVVESKECEIEVLSEEKHTRNALVPLATALLATTLFASPALADAGLNLDFGNIEDGFASAFLLIFFSEIGDKTFFIAVLLALKQPQSAVFVGTFGALAIMSFISVFLGEVLHLIDEGVHDFLPPAIAELPLDDFAAIALLVYFGITTIQGADASKATALEEKEEAEEEVTKLSTSLSGSAGALAPLVASTFFLVFAAEWGDKSFLATIALAASASPLGVVAGAIAGHGVATGIAVVGGGILGDYVSERVVAYVGGSLFLVFAGATLIEDFA